MFDLELIPKSGSELPVVDSRRVAEDKAIEVGIVSKRIKIVVVLSAKSKVGLQIDGALE